MQVIKVSDPRAKVDVYFNVHEVEYLVPFKYVDGARLFRILGCYQGRYGSVDKRQDSYGSVTRGTTMSWFLS